jgi:hypothetical protein
LIIFSSREGKETTSIAMQTVYSLAWSNDLIVIGQVGRPALVKITDNCDAKIQCYCSTLREGVAVWRWALSASTAT